MAGLPNGLARPRHNVLILIFVILNIFFCCVVLCNFRHKNGYPIVVLGTGGGIEPTRICHSGPEVRVVAHCAIVEKKQREGSNQRGHAERLSEDRGQADACSIDLAEPLPL